MQPRLCREVETTSMQGSSETFYVSSLRHPMVVPRLHRLLRTAYKAIILVGVEAESYKRGHSVEACARER